MSNLRIYDNPKGKWLRAGQYPPLSISGALPDYVTEASYEGRLQVNGMVGNGFAWLVAGELPPGAMVTVDQATDEIVVSWPAYVSTNGSIAIANADFEDGDRDWLLGAGWDIGTWNWEYDGPDNDLQAYDGTKSAEYHAGFRGNSQIVMATPAPCAEGTTVTASCQVQQGPSSANHTGGWVLLQFLDVTGAVLATHEGNHVNSSNDAEWHLSTVTATAPAGTTHARLGGEGYRRLESKPMWLDTFAWDLTGDAVELGTNGTEEICITLGVRDSAGRDAYWSGCISADARSIGGTLPDAIVGVPYSTDLPITGSGPFGNLQLLAGALPAGLASSIVGSSVRVSGTPTVTGAFSPQFSVDDVLGDPILGTKPFHSVGLIDLHGVNDAGSSFPYGQFLASLTPGQTLNFQLKGISNGRTYDAWNPYSTDVGNPNSWRNTFRVYDNNGTLLLIAFPVTAPSTGYVDAATAHAAAAGVVVQAVVATIGVYVGIDDVPTGDNRGGLSLEWWVS